MAQVCKEEGAKVVFAGSKQIVAPRVGHVIRSFHEGVSARSYCQPPFALVMLLASVYGGISHLKFNCRGVDEHLRSADFNLRELKLKFNFGTFHARHICTVITRD